MKEITYSTCRSKVKWQDCQGFFVHLVDGKVVLKITTSYSHLSLDSEPEEL